MLGGGAWAERIPSIFGSGWRGTSPRAGRGGRRGAASGSAPARRCGSRRARRRAARWRRAGRGGRPDRASSRPTRLSRRAGRGGARHHDAGAGAGARGRARGEGRSLVDLARADPRRHDVQKKSLIASERERADVRAARADWTRRRQPRMREEPHRLVFVDECGTRTNMTRLRGRARRGARVRDHAPLRHKGTQTFVAGLRYDRLAAPWLLDGPMNRAAFDVWVETQLAPELGKGDVVMLDNLAVHRSPRAAESSAPTAPGSCSCRPTRPTSTRSRWPSPSSRPICAASAPAPSTPSGAPSAKSAASSIQTNAGTTLGRQGMYQFKRTSFNRWGSQVPLPRPLTKTLGLGSASLFLRARRGSRSRCHRPCLRTTNPIKSVAFAADGPGRRSWRRSSRFSRTRSRRSTH